MTDVLEYKWKKINNKDEALSIQFEDGSIAQGYAAEFIVQKTELENITIQEVVSQLNSYNEHIKTYIDNMNTSSPEDAKWEVVFDLIFNNLMYKKISSLLKSINMELEYYNPDTSYYEDVMAFVNAFNIKMEKLNSLVFDKNNLS